MQHWSYEFSSYREGWWGSTFFSTAVITRHEIQWKIHYFSFHWVLSPAPPLFFLSLLFPSSFVQNRISLFSCLRVGCVCPAQSGYAEVVVQLANHLPGVLVAPALARKHSQRSLPGWVRQDSLPRSVSLVDGRPHHGRAQEMGKRDTFHHHSSDSGCCLLFAPSHLRGLPLSPWDVKGVGSIPDWQWARAGTQRWVTRLFLGVSKLWACQREHSYGAGHLLGQSTECIQG